MSLADGLALADMRGACRSGLAPRDRQSAGLTVREVGKIAGVTPRAVRLRETGRRNPAGGPALAHAKLLRQLQRKAA
jgi:transcriptional regulator with XRE-family HTH domain